MEYYVPGEIYANLRKFIVRIGGNLTEPALAPQALSVKLGSDEYVVITAPRRGDPRGDAVLTCIYVAESSKITNKIDSVRKLIAKVAKKEKTELMIITHNPIKKQIIEKLVLPDELALHNYPANIFLTDPLTSVHVPTHTLASNEEITSFCHTWFTSVDKFPKILESDPQAIWIGARPGSVVKVERSSESAGSAIVYRVCVCRC
jgi:DNA-directed RNA polymerase subunit H (RpoH/RPB5)